jgi:hypothetical protein
MKPGTPTKTEMQDEIVRLRSQLAEIDRERAEYGQHAGCRINEKRYRAELAAQAVKLAEAREECERLRDENHVNLCQQSEDHERETASIKAQLAHLVETASHIEELRPMPPLVLSESAELARLRAIEEAARLMIQLCEDNEDHDAEHEWWVPGYNALAGALEGGAGPGKVP